MRWFIYWATGSCNDGSCAYGFESFLTEAEAVGRLKELRSKYGRPQFDFSVSLVYGLDLTSLAGVS